MEEGRIQSGGRGANQQRSQPSSQNNRQHGLEELEGKGRPGLDEDEQDKAIDCKVGWGWGWIV